MRGPSLQAFCVHTHTQRERSPCQPAQETMMGTSLQQLGCWWQKLHQNCQYKAAEDYGKLAGSWRVGRREHAGESVAFPTEEITSSDFSHIIILTMRPKKKKELGWGRETEKPVGNIVTDDNSGNYCDGDDVG